MNLSIDDVRVVLEEIIPIKVGAEVSSIYKFRAGNTIWWSSDSGLIVKEKSPAGFTLYSQVEKFAKDLSDRRLFDYASLPFFKSNKMIQNPETLNTLKVKVNGFPLQAKLYENSTVILKDSILTMQKIEVQILKEKSYQLPFKGDKFDRYLSPDKWVVSDYKPLQDTGVIYARSSKNDAFLFANYLKSYVFNLVRLRPLFTLSDSRGFLDSLSGDYLEKTVMFATYARAGGLPTRLIGGFVYLKGYFYFHTWPEVWFNQWIPLDPTFVQFPADVTHIPLKEGNLEDITSIIKDLKSVTIEILEAS
ncbi:MAG: transglutaminase-like domain-containing protein, partial [Nitrospirota bacterium]